MTIRYHAHREDICPRVGFLKKVMYEVIPEE